MYHAFFSDTEIPVFTYCLKCIKKDDLTTLEVRVQWQSPTATDNSGAIPAVTCNRAPGDLFPVPSSTEIHCRAEDPAGNVATCSFRVILKSKYSLGLSDLFVTNELLSLRLLKGWITLATR